MQKKGRRIDRRGLAVLVASLAAFNAHAQRPNENAVAEASDAFGTAIGREVVGLYSSSSARGFSPTQAGNLRISGLYFDQVPQATPVDRIMRGSTVHVGISAQGFPFPAPTGVVDFQLRSPGNTPHTSLLLGGLTYGQQYAELDFETPVVDEVLSVGGGGSYWRDNNYRWTDWSSFATAGVIARWRPKETLTITPFWGGSRQLEEGEAPGMFLGESVPAFYRTTSLPLAHYARNRIDSETLGTTVQYRPNDVWAVDAGIFRSKSDNVIPYFDPIAAGVNFQHEIADYSVELAPPRVTQSTSGELRLARRFDLRNVRNTLYLSVKGRNRSSESGGADRYDYGPGTFSMQVPRERPDFHLGPVSTLEAHQITPGIAYEGVWRDVGQLSLGLQKSWYESTLREPASSGAATVSGASRPWLYNVGGAWFVTRRLAVYASSTRGFEEIGTAPVIAVNRDQAVPAQVTKQVDAGVRYAFTPSLALVAGIFEIEKPYFNLDAQNVFREVGVTRNRGAELSLSGALTDQLTVVAGYIHVDPRVEYATNAGATASEVAVGPIPGLLRINLQYRTPFLEGLILDGKLERISSRYTAVQGLSVPAATTIDVGARYNTHLLDKPATFRFQAYNVGNTNYLTVFPSGQIISFEARHMELSLAIEF